MDEKDVYWLAGLLEGEGSFLSPAPSEPGLPRIKIDLADEDVIVRVAHLFEVNYYSRRRRKEHWNESYTLQVKGSRAVKIMQQLNPLMGERRKRQIREAISYVPVALPLGNQEYLFHWLAGLLEGEGSFLKGAPSESNKRRIQMQMTDRDVMERAATLLNARVRGPYCRPNAQAHWKPHFTIFLRGSKAVVMMRQLHPLMGQRRQAQIDAALASYIPDRDHGDNHPQAKLTAEKVREIKRRLAEGEKLTRLAREYHVDKGLIWQIKAGRIWQHVT